MASLPRGAATPTSGRHSLRAFAAGVPLPESFALSEPPPPPAAVKSPPKLWCSPRRLPHSPARTPLSPGLCAGLKSAPHPPLHRPPQSSAASECRSGDASERCSASAWSSSSASRSPLPPRAVLTDAGTQTELLRTEGQVRGWACAATGTADALVSPRRRAQTGAPTVWSAPPRQRSDRAWLRAVPPATWSPVPITVQRTVMQKQVSWPAPAPLPCAERPVDVLVDWRGVRA
eukprot:TRINITY_DN21683_c0_g1_i1.p2 TRINITY_DN21683_c0_g1~~TRINITY_DN21683_c0_g1_i1.p2  ORF type:complete len:232 (+),score=45.55 TRINITY_DN21683_c0_g1_i1:53-748(+)